MRVNDSAAGAALRTARIRRGWTQAELAAAASVSASLVSVLERGHLDDTPLRRLRQIAAALEIRVSLNLWLRAGDLDRLMNAGHAALHEDVARMLGALPGWLQLPEVSFAVYSERGVIDILAFHAPTGSLLVIELKTELVSLEDLLTTMDVRRRHATKIAAERGWQATSVSCWVILSDTTPNRRRAARHSATLRSAFPDDGRRMRAWLKRPSGSRRALSFWSNSSGRGANEVASLRRRVRHHKPVSDAV